MAERGGNRTERLRADIWQALYGLFMAEHESHLEAAAELDVTPGDLKTLIALEPGRADRMRDLAEKWRCDASTVTWVVNRLETRNLVERRAHESDRRVKVVVLSERGVKLRTKLLEHVYRPPEVLANLSAAELQTLHELVKRLCPGPA
ncbi:MarR family winged helix-turn-helix transcriptional regulator [Saccharopolyspora phatthalungensis]|uniref:DNA-binding MarR family transcriptional regulator n=1 Tax=Saccharopolyspora phatthalungensis TaxID=664693 RepID=A0A840QHI0_9PSEU|nr:MarR family transcriptional regulator [Saccharopolyspora phatthalungensis]MBB5158005.1 DNA-binding MarR family transcriptional regulator [Saccharopolyspora phatthalungensis]